MGDPSVPKTTRFPRAFGKYQLLREAGRGGRGVVYEATDTVLQRTVALKVTRVPPAGADDAGLLRERERFLVEARIGAHLPKHPHIVSVYEAGEIDGRQYLASEFIPGAPMLLWSRNPSMTVARQVRLLRDVALAIEHAHRHGVIHRDLKPGNILVDGSDQPHVADFGLAKMAGQPIDLARLAPGQVLGTPSYMSPEHARGSEAVDARADVYSLGAILYEILAGRPPFHGVPPAEAAQRIVAETVPPPSAAARGAFPPAQRALEALALKALSKDPGQRPAGAAAFADALTRWLDGPRPTLRRTTVAPKRSAVPMLALAGAGLLAVAVAAFAFLKDPEPAAPAEADLARAREGIDAERRRAADHAAAEARREEAERARAQQERLLGEAERRRRAEEEEALKQQALLTAQRREAEERALKAEERLRQASPALPPAPSPPAPAPAPPPAPPAPSPPAPAPGPRIPAAPNPGGLPKVLPDGTLHWEAEDYTGGEKAVKGRDFHDNSPGNVGRAYRNHDVDIAANPDGSFWVGAIEPGEWLNYKLEAEGRYEVEIRYVAGQAASFHLEVDGLDVTGALHPPQTAQGAWGTFRSVTQRLPPETHNLRFVFDVRMFGLDWLRLKKVVPAAPPTAAQLREAEKAIRALFKADYARKSPGDLQALAQKLLQEGARAEGDPVARYALLSEAREVAEQAADVATVLAAVEELDRRYAIDAAGMRQESLAGCARAARTPDASRAVAEAHLALADQAAARDDFDAVAALGGKAEALARASQDAGLVAHVQARAKELAAQRDEFRPVRAALKTLEERPDDPAANSAAGAYRCFVRNDWVRGLPHLAKGSDSALAALARKELEGVDDAPRQAALGDAWREAGEKKSGATKSRLLARALHWYEKALAGLAGIDRLKVEGHVEALYRVVGGEWAKKGLVFWVDPGRDPGDALREHVFGARYSNGGARVQDAGSRVFAFSATYVDYAAPEAVRNVDRAGSIFFWVRSEGPFAAVFNRADPDRGQNDLWVWIQGGVLTLGFNFPDNPRRYNSRGAVPQGRWTLCGVTWDERTVTFYVDGKEDIASPIGPNPLFPPRRISKVRVGAYNLPGAGFQGQVGWVMVYNRALSAQEAGQLYGGSRARFR